VEVRFVENLPVISGLSPAAPNDLALKIGDVITELDSAPVAKLIENWRPYYATSNDAALMHVGSLQVLLDKGQEDDWFGSHFIATLAATAAVCLITLVIWEWFRKDPVIDVRMFKSFNFAAANLMMFMMGFLLFSTLVLIPEFLQTLMGYTAGLAGLVLSGGGLVLLIMMPLTGRLTSKIQARYLIAAGWLCLAIGLFYSAHQLDLFINFRFAMWLRITQVVGIGFLFVPITAAGYIGVPPEKGNSASGMINFMRNIGGSIGTSLATTLIVRRSQYHQQILVGHLTPVPLLFVPRSIH
jgi:MFS transporter, DHA2 family, multidrug resistance protein